MKNYTMDTLKSTRRELKLSQQEVADCLGVSKGMISHLENGRKEITEEMCIKLEKLFEDRRTKLAEQSKVNIEYLERFYNARVVFEEEKRLLQEQITKERKQQDFNPCILPSVDMVWLSSTLAGEQAKDFEDHWLRVLNSSDLQVDFNDYGYPTLERGRYRGVIQCKDGKIHVEYLFLVKGEGNTPIPRLKVQFNPNKVKWDNKYLINLMGYLGENPIMRKWDVCKDYIHTKIDNSVISNNAARSITIYRSKMGYKTCQFGDMNKNGTRFYDKRGELIEKDNKDIGYECTRVETRVTLPKSLALNDMESLDINVMYPTMTLINEEITKLALGFDINPILKSCFDSVVRGDSFVEDYKKVSRNMYDNLIQFIDKVKTTVIALTQEEVKLATLRFRNRYREVYFLNHGVGKNF